MDDRFPWLLLLVATASGVCCWCGPPPPAAATALGYCLWWLKLPVATTWCGCHYQGFPWGQGGGGCWKGRGTITWGQGRAQTLTKTD